MKRLGYILFGVLCTAVIGLLTSIPLFLAKYLYAMIAPTTEMGRILVVFGMILVDTSSHDCLDCGASGWQELWVPLKELLKP